MPFKDRAKQLAYQKKWNREHSAQNPEPEPEPKAYSSAPEPGTRNPSGSVSWNPEPEPSEPTEPLKIGVNPDTVAYHRNRPRTRRQNPEPETESEPEKWKGDYPDRPEYPFNPEYMARWRKEGERRSREASKVVFDESEQKFLTPKKTEVPAWAVLVVGVLIVVGILLFLRSRNSNPVSAPVVPTTPYDNLEVFLT